MNSSLLGDKKGWKNLNMLTKETAQNLMKIEGETRGVVFKTDQDFILKKGGKEGLKKVEKELEKLGYPISYKEMETLAFYPIGLRVLSLLVISQVFNLKEEEIKEMGASAPRVSLIIKFFMQYFLSIRKTFEQVSKIWRKHYTIGDLAPVELNEEEKFLVLRLENFNLHPLFCQYLVGYFRKIAEMILKSEVKSQETECFFRGDDYHQFLLKW